MLTPIAAPDRAPSSREESAMWPRWLRAEPHMPDGTALASRRIVVAEDNSLIVADVAETLRAQGAEVVECSSLRDLIDIIRSGQAIDVALLDLMLGDQLVYPAADDLMASDVPFVFFSGYDRHELPERFAACRFLSKPVSSNDLVITLI